MRTFTVTVEFVERDEQSTLMSVHIASEGGEIGTTDNDACKIQDLKAWIGQAIIDDARAEQSASIARRIEVGEIAL